MDKGHSAVRNDEGATHMSQSGGQSDTLETTMSNIQPRKTMSEVTDEYRQQIEALERQLEHAKNLQLVSWDLGEATGKRNAERAERQRDEALECLRDLLSFNMSETRNVGGDRSAYLIGWQDGDSSRIDRARALLSRISK